MHVSTIVISQEAAQHKVEAYKSLKASQRLDEDTRLQAVYASILKGGRVINLAAAFRETGFNEQYQPQLAIARADWADVYCFKDPYRRGWQRAANTLGFGDQPRWNDRATARNVLLPNGTMIWPAETKWYQLRSPVPHIPPQCRPKIGLHNYHILFEVKTWTEYPVDPFLLRRVMGQIYVVEAEWELTPLEAMLLGSMAE